MVVRSTRLLIACLTLLALGAAQTERKQPGSEAELAAITERGRALAKYDFAAWHGTDAFLAAISPENRARVHYSLAHEDEGVWEVVFGDIDPDKEKFLVFFEAQQGGPLSEFAGFAGTTHAPAKELAGFYFLAARALALAKEEFKASGFHAEGVTYNSAVLPAAGGQFYVYFYPAQTDLKIWPLGADTRYLISADGLNVVQRRRMHKSILQFELPKDNATVEAEFHIAVMDEVPEDTDVFFTMSRKPAVDHIIVSKHFVYVIHPDGKAVYLTTAKEFLKKR